MSNIIQVEMFCAGQNDETLEKCEVAIAKLHKSIQYGIKISTLLSAPEATKLRSVCDDTAKALEDMKLGGCCTLQGLRHLALQQKKAMHEFRRLMP